MTSRALNTILRCMHVPLRVGFKRVIRYEPDLKFGYHVHEPYESFKEFKEDLNIKRRI